MRRIVPFAGFVCAATGLLGAAPCSVDRLVLDGVRVRVACDAAGSWTLDAQVRTLEPGVAELSVTLDSPVVATQPVLTVSWDMPQRDLPHVWSPEANVYGIPPVWGPANKSDLAHWMPVYSFFSDDNENRLAVAADEAVRPVSFRAALVEEKCSVDCRWTFFAVKPPPSRHEKVVLRFDARRIFWSDAVAAAADWLSAMPRYRPLRTPPSAFAPLYSSWYGFHQGVFAGEIEAECRIARSLGMGTIILDDGWETDDVGRGFAFTGDWEVSPRRFPDFPAHVRTVREMGMKYVVWIALPFVGPHAAAFERFAGKYLPGVRKDGTRTLDPRFPEVRAHLVSLLERRLLDWGVDGFKIDFIGEFEDGVPASPGDGRDIAGVPEATERLMTEIADRLVSVKPDVLIEFRQPYVGAAIHRFGNMMRASDCPGDMARNRRSIARLRLTSGTSAVHGDMLEWHPSDTAENAARFILNSIFGVVQYSMVLGRLPPRHLEMVRHWIRFSLEHEEALLHGRFRAYWPQHAYPMLVGESEKEAVVGVYGSGLTVRAPQGGKTTYVLNATGADSLAVELGAPATVTASDTYGVSQGTATYPAGLRRVACPPSGYLEIRGETETVLELPPTPDNPRNSEGAFVRLKDGSLLFAWSRFYEAGKTEHGSWDNGGRTWRPGEAVDVFAADGTRVVTQEPGVIELKDGRVMMWARTTAGSQHAGRSDDGGITWGPFGPTDLVGPCSPATIRRLKSGELLAIWNDHRERPEFRGRRAPLSLAVSRDEGLTWSASLTLDANPTGHFCYVSAIDCDDGVLLACCTKTRRNLDTTRVTRVPGKVIDDLRRKK